MKQKDINSFLYDLYDDVSPITVSIRCRKKHGIDDQAFVYGESHLPSMSVIFQEMRPRAGEIFYDLGCGSGRLLLYAALSFSFAKCIGVELLDDLVNIAKAKLELCNKRLVKLSLPKLSTVEFVHADFTKIDVSDADVVYIAATCFSNKFMRSLALFLANQLASGSRVITLTKNLPAKQFRINKSQFYPMEWGQTTVVFHERV